MISKGLIPMELSEVSYQSFVLKMEFSLILFRVYHKDTHSKDNLSPVMTQKSDII